MLLQWWIGLAPTGSNNADLLQMSSVTTFVMFLGKTLSTFTLLVPVSSVSVGQYVIKFHCEIPQIKIKFLWKTAESGGIITESESSKDVTQVKKKDSDTLSKSLNNNYI